MERIKKEKLLLEIRIEIETERNAMILEAKFNDITGSWHEAFLLY